MFDDRFSRLVKTNQEEKTNNGFLVKRRPPVDIYETQNELVILGEMPGVNRDELKVQIKDGLLHIAGKRKNSSDENEYIFREIDNVQYERIFELGKDLDPEKISANYNGGILKVVIGKKEVTKPKQITIK